MRKYLNTKYIWGYVLALVCLAHSLYPLFYSVSLFRIREAQQEVLRYKDFSKQLQTIYLPGNEFARTFDRDDNEIEMDGRRFDVVNYTPVNGLVQCIVLYDEKETTLNNQTDIQRAIAGTSAKPMGYWWPMYAMPLIPFQPEYVARPAPASTEAKALLLREGYRDKISQPPELYL